MTPRMATIASRRNLKAGLADGGMREFDSAWHLPHNRRSPARMGNARDEDTTMRLTVACIQNSAQTEMAPNLEETATLTREAAADGAELVCLPEYFSCLDVVGNMLLAHPLAEEEHPALPLFSGLARDLGIHVLLGSLAIATGGEKFVNRSYLLSNDGEILARYDKIHLFDVDLAGGESYRESASVAPGDQAVLASTPWGPLGMSICYDLRFPMLYRSLAQAGATMLTVPAAFTKTTGEAHWHVLMRARAIENGCFVFAPSQHGVHASGSACFGHSLIVDPWGKVLADAGDEAGYALAECDLDAVAKARGMIASLQHDRAFEPPRLEAPPLQAVAGAE